MDRRLAVDGSASSSEMSAGVGAGGLELELDGASSSSQILSREVDMITSDEEVVNDEHPLDASVASFTRYLASFGRDEIHDHSPGLTRNEINDNNLQVSTDLQNFDMAKAQPNVSEGITYWEKQTADYNGVLG